MKNLFYSLPDDIMHLIHKKVFSDCVLPQITSRPGNFSKYLIHENSSQGYKDYAYELENSYRKLNKFAPGVWDFLKRYKNFMWYADRYHPFYNVIIDSLSLDCDDIELFRSKLQTMTYLARYGWNNYVISVAI
jgi:hypothetical protein